MTEPRPVPWNPPRRWADPMIALLLLLAVLTTVEALALRRKAPVGPRRVGMQTRIVELQAAAMDTVGRPWRLTDPRHDLGPWDHATLAILLAEKERLAEGESHVALAPAEFQPWWRAAYQNEPYPPGDMPSSLKPGLARGYAYFRLHAKLAEARGVDPSPFEDQAQAWARLRSVALVLGGFAGLALVMVGLGSLVFLLVTRRKGPPPEDCPMTWRGAALAFLGWFVALRFSGTAAAIIFKVLPLPKALA
ncbi:MAG: hypothetical protein LWX11_00640, partial [Firmicutes bacterium]|nr:hypothetical protein [Bacillota bacterium]